MRVSTVTIRHIKIFVQVYQMRNITRAAESLHMTQPAVTRAIHEMEDYYGVCLFERMSRRLSPTETANQLYAQALHIVDLFDAMDRELRNWDSFGILRVGASITLGNFLLPPLVSQFQKDHPNTTVQVTISNGGSLQRKLLDNQLDIALVEGWLDDVNLHTEEFHHDRMVLIVPPGHPLLSQKAVNLQDIQLYPLLLREEGSAGRRFLNEFFSAHGMVLHPTWESVSTQALVKAVTYGIGISLLPEQLVCQDIADGHVCTLKIEDANLTRQHYLVWHKNKYLNSSLRSFINLCRTK
ncbi:LysR substrate-binding domain-containing protein [Oscillibacter sp.]|uniref:LysR family transcriptional regulator n=1 Tax=Oscillibacter sp. TaxID=1945593 RepID=UPI00339586C1